MPDPAELQTVDPERSDPAISSTLLIGGVGVIVTFLVVVLLQVLFYRTAEAEYRRKVVAATPAELRAVRVEQTERLNGYRWIDRERGIVAIPIERAMELIVEEAAGRGDGR